MSDIADVRLAARTHRRSRAITLRHGGMLAAGLLGAVGLLFAGQAAQLDLGDLGLPGPGFFPLVLASAVLAFCVVIGVECWRSPATDERVEFGHRDVVIVFAALLAVPLLFESCGAYVTLGLFAATLLVFVARLSLPLALATSALGMAACWLFFQVLLEVQLPAGPF